MDIRTKLVLALVTSSLLSMALFGYLTYLLSFDLFLRSMTSQLAAIASSRASRIDHMIDDWWVEAHELAEQIEPGMDSLASISLSESDVRGHRATRWISIYDESGSRVLTTYPELAPMRAPEVGSDTAGVRVLPGGGNAVFLAVMLDSGVMVAGFDAQALHAITGDRNGLGVTGRSLLVAPSWISPGGERVQGFLMVNPPSDASSEQISGPLTQAPAVLAAALAAGDTDIAEGDYHGTPVIASTRSLQGATWRVVVQMDASEEVARVDELLRQMRDLGLSLGALVIFGGIVFGVYLSRRIRKLSDTVERIRHGELDLRPEVEGGDEVALLARSFNEFINQLDRSSDIFQLGALRVLVVEDSADSRYLLNELLTNWRMRAIVVEDEGTALQVIREAEEAQEPIQLLLLDGKVCGLEPTALADQLDALKDVVTCPIILLAEDPPGVDAGKLKQLGVGHVVPKPVVASDLMEAILEEMGLSAEAMGSMADVFLTPMKPRRILLAEDSPIIQRVTVGFLEKWGHRVTVAGNGRLAVEASGRENFDIILMDLEMPEMNGLDAALRIREGEKQRGGRTPIVALTARATKAAREECMAAGMDDYIAKPVDPKLLYRIVGSYPATLETDESDESDETDATDATDAPDIVEERVMSEDKPRLPGLDSSAAAEQASTVDWGVARSLTGGDESLLDELVELFPVESSKHLEAVRTGIEANDAQQLARGAHSLKSAAGFFGATTLVACALEVENLGNASNVAEAENRLPELEAQTAQLIDELGRERPPA